MAHRALRSATLIGRASVPVAIVLPPREAFSPGASGALGLIARRHALWPGAFAATVVGAPPPTPPFDGVAFAPARRHWFGYAAAAAREARGIGAGLVEVHNRPDLALSLARRLRRVPVALILNNDPQDMRGARTPAERTRLLRRLAGVAVASSYLGGRLMEGMSSASAAPFVLPNCLDSGEVPAPVGVREETILFAGRVVADKGADAFVDACALALPDLPGWRAAMVGGDRFGPDNPDTPFLRALRPRATAAGVAMLGYRPHAAVMDAMARAAIVVVPSRWREPFGLTAVEAMACGAALLCSNRGGLAEVTGDAAVPIDPDDAAGLADVLRAVARDPDRRAALGAAGRARAKAFDMAAIGPRLDEFRAAARARFHAAGAGPI